MALNWTLDKQNIPAKFNLGDSHHISTGTVAFDNNYASGGEPFTIKDVGLQSRLDLLIFQGGVPAGMQIEWIPSEMTLRVYVPASGTHAEEGQSDPGISAARFFAIGY